MAVLGNCYAWRHGEEQVGAGEGANNGSESTTQFVEGPKLGTSSRTAVTDKDGKLQTKKWNPAPQFLSRAFILHAQGRQPYSWYGRTYYRYIHSWYARTYYRYIRYGTGAGPVRQKDRTVVSPVK